MTRYVQRRDVLRGVGAAGAVGLAGCLGDGGGGGREIRLGMLMGVTGSLEQLGPPIRDAASLVPQQINDADTDYSVNTQFEDTGTDATQGVSGAEALVNADYPAIVGALSSQVTLQVANNVTIPNQVTQCSPASTTPDLTTLEDDDYVFRTTPGDAQQGALLAQIAADRLGHGTAATLYLNNAYGSGLNQGFATAFEEDYGGTITNQVSFSEGADSYSSQLTNTLQGDPDTFLIVGYPEEGVQIFRDFYTDFDRGGMDVLVSDGLQDSGLPGDVGYDMTNVTGTAPSGEGPSLETFQSLYQETYDADPAGQPFIKQAYDAAAVLVLANAAAGENDGTAVRDNLRPVTEEGGTEVTADNIVEGVEMADDGEEINYQGVSGDISFDDAGDLGEATFEYFEFTSDGLEIVDTMTPP